jgi:hypothetical protein
MANENGIHRALKAAVAISVGAEESFSDRDSLRRPILFLTPNERIADVYC